jgi:hypothetical protein
VFIQDDTRTRVAAEPADIVALLESVNQPLVALAGRPGESAKAAVVGLRQEGGFTVVIAMHFLDTVTNVVFADDRGPVDAETLRGIFDEAVQFSEQMGFILDDPKWRELSEEARAELLGRLAMFHEPPKGPRLPPQDEKLLRLAKLLASF